MSAQPNTPDPDDELDAALQHSAGFPHPSPLGAHGGAVVAVVGSVVDMLVAVVVAAPVPVLDVSSVAAVVLSSSSLAVASAPCDALAEVVASPADDSVRVVAIVEASAVPSVFRSLGGGSPKQPHSRTDITDRRVIGRSSQP